MTACQSSKNAWAGGKKIQETAAGADRPRCRDPLILVLYLRLPGLRSLMAASALPFTGGDKNFALHRRAATYAPPRTGGTA